MNDNRFDTPETARSDINTQLSAWLDYMAKDNASSDKPETPQYVRDERQYNRAVVRVNGRGFNTAFLEVTRTFSASDNNPDGKTRIVTRLITYDGKQKTVNGKKALAKVTRGDKCWRHGMGYASFNVPAMYSNAQAMTRDEHEAWENAVKAVVSGNLWGKNDVKAYVAELRTLAQANGFEVLTSNI